MNTKSTRYTSRSPIVEVYRRTINGTTVESGYRGGYGTVIAVKSSFRGSCELYDLLHSIALEKLRSMSTEQ